jgi:hypothetical protein
MCNALCLRFFQSLRAADDNAILGQTLVFHGQAAHSLTSEAGFSEAVESKNVLT